MINFLFIVALYYSIGMLWVRIVQELSMKNLNMIVSFDKIAYFIACSMWPVSMAAAMVEFFRNLFTSEDDENN